MKTPATLRTIASFTLAVSLLSVLPPAWAQRPGTGEMKMDPQHDAHASMAAMTDKLRPLHGKEFETQFLKEMIGHHQSAVDMARLVPANTNRPELNQMAAGIIADQEKEIARMTGWLKSWFGQGPDAMAMMMPGMDALKAAKDVAFDRMWVDLMKEHHRGAVEMSKLVADRAEHAELKGLASTIIASQGKEIARMNQWQKEWR